MKNQSRPTVGSLRWSKSLSALPVLSIRQPFAWLVAKGIKDVENRSKRTHYRGPILVHASKSRERLSPCDIEYWQKVARTPLPDDYNFGGVIGVVEIVDCVRRHPSVWKERGYWGWVLADAKTVKFRECKGAVGFFYPDW